MKKLRIILVFIISLLMINITSVSAESWDKPVYAYGSDLSDTERETIANDFGYKEDEIDLLMISNDDLVKYLGFEQDYANSGTMHSSAIIVKKEKGFGVKVKIGNPELITEVTEGEYENAMITAGVENAEVLIGALGMVTGHSALAGIFKAYDDKGAKLDEDRMLLAQQELVLSSGIIQEHKFHEEFDINKFNEAIRTMKIELAKHKKGEVTEEDASHIVNNALIAQALETILTNINIEELIELMLKYSQTGAIDSDGVVQQLKQGDEKAEVDIDDGLIDKIMSLLKKFIEFIFSIFASEVDNTVTVDGNVSGDENTNNDEEDQEANTPNTPTGQEDPDEADNNDGSNNIGQSDGNCEKQDYSSVTDHLVPGFFIPDCSIIEDLSIDQGMISAKFSLEADWQDIYKSYKEFVGENLQSEKQNPQSGNGEIVAKLYGEDSDGYTLIFIEQSDEIVFFRVTNYFPTED